MKVCLGTSRSLKCLHSNLVVPRSQDPSRPIGTLTKPDCSTKTYQAYGRRGSPEHSSSQKFPASAPKLRRQKSSPFLSRLSGSTRRKCLTAPTLPSSAASWMSLPRDTSPTPWELLEGARLVSRDTQIATPSRTGKPS